MARDWNNLETQCTGFSCSTCQISNRPQTSSSLRATTSSIIIYALGNGPLANLGSKPLEPMFNVPRTYVQCASNLCLID